MLLKNDNKKIKCEGHILERYYKSFLFNAFPSKVRPLKVNSTYEPSGMKQPSSSMKQLGVFLLTPGLGTGP